MVRRLSGAFPDGQGQRSTQIRLGSIMTLLGTPEPTGTPGGRLRSYCGRSLRLPGVPTVLPPVRLGGLPVISCWTRHSIGIT